MNLFRYAAIAALLCIATPAFAHNGFVHNGCNPSQSFTASGITVSGAYTRATAPNAASAGGYLTIVNDGATADRLVGVSSQVAAKVEVHQMRMEGDMMKMSPVEGGLDIPAGGTVALEPMGYHLMFMQLESPFKQGECIEVVLQFANAGDVPVTLGIGSLSQDGPVMDHDMGEMSHDMSASH